jgi:hypothetical protein
MKEALRLQEDFKSLEHLHLRRELSGGQSGASVNLLQGRYLKEGRLSPSLHIAKIFEDSERGLRDAESEREGFELLCESWGVEHLTDRPHFLELGGRCVALFSFADKTSVNVSSVKSLIEQDLLSDKLEQITVHYKQLPPYGPAPVQLKSLHSYLALCLEEKLVDKLLSGKDAPMFEDPEEWIVISGRLYESPIYNVRHRSGDALSHVAHVMARCQHGDLNAENVIFTNLNQPDEGFVFIDLEKARPSSPFYDLSFLLMWVIKATLLEDPERRATLKNRAPGALRDDLLRYIAGSIRETQEQAVEHHIISQGVPTFIIKVLTDGLRELLGGLGEIEEDEHHLLRFTFAIAALVRCYYEAREVSRAVARGDKAAREARHEDALFYRDLATLVLSEPLRGLSGRTEWPTFTVSVNGDSTTQHAKEEL